MDRYSKEECMELLRGSADASFFRTELIISAGGFAVWMLWTLLMLMESVTAFLMSLLLGLLLFGGIAAFEGIRLWRLYRHWDRYEYLLGRVDQEIATYDWRRDCTALQVIADRPDGTGVVAVTRNIFRQKSAWLDGWPIATHYANSEVLVAYDPKEARAIILKRNYRKRT